VTWEKRVLDLFDDLEQQAEGLALAERDAAVAELGRAEYAEVDLAARLHATVGQPVQLVVRGAGAVHGRVGRAGAGWCLVVGDPAGSSETVVRLAALMSARGLSPRAVPEAVRGPLARLGFASVVRRLAEEGAPLVMVLLDGATRRGTALRVGADFVELTPGDGAVEVVPFAAIATVRAG
jgi:D-arabinose 5-phosphate isomerase GutQ